MQSFIGFRIYDEETHSAPISLFNVKKAQAG